MFSINQILFRIVLGLSIFIIVFYLIVAHSPSKGNQINRNMDLVDEHIESSNEETEKESKINFNGEIVIFETEHFVWIRHPFWKSKIIDTYELVPEYLEKKIKQGYIPISIQAGHPPYWLFRKTKKEAYETNSNLY